MIAVSSLDDLARRLAGLVPAAFAGVRASAPTYEVLEDLSVNFRDALRSGLRRLDLVTREEFDVQRCVLLRTREIVESLEHRVAELEALLAGKASPH